MYVFKCKKDIKMSGQVLASRANITTRQDSVMGMNMTKKEDRQNLDAPQPSITV